MDELRVLFTADIIFAFRRKIIRVMVISAKMFILIDKDAVKKRARQKILFKTRRWETGVVFPFFFVAKFNKKMVACDS